MRQILNRAATRFVFFYLQACLLTSPGVCDAAEAQRLWGLFFDSILAPAQLETLGFALTPPPATPVVQPAALPHLDLPLIGRDTDLAQLDSLLARQRLITVSGPGGVGKTRLALALAHTVQSAQQFPDGVYFVDLAPITAPHGVPTTIARSIGLPLTTQSPVLDVLQTAITTRTMLLSWITLSTPARGSATPRCASAAANTCRKQATARAL